MNDGALQLATVDWVALGLVGGGVLLGFTRGLGSTFSMLLWLVAAMWMGKAFTPKVIDWFPRIADTTDMGALLFTYGILVTAILVIALFVKLRKSSGKKGSSENKAENKQMGALVGILNGALLFTFLVPFAHDHASLSETWRAAKAPPLAVDLASRAPFLFPESFQEAIASTVQYSDEIRPYEK